MNNPLDNGLMERTGETVIRTRFANNVANNGETVGLNGLGLLDIMHTVVLRPRQITRTAPQ